MKHTLLCMLLACGTLVGYTQVFDSAIRYRMSPSFYAAMDTLIARATNPTDTSKENEAELLTRQKYFMGSRICLDVPAGGDKGIICNGKIVVAR